MTNYKLSKFWILNLFLISLVFNNSAYGYDSKEVDSYKEYLIKKAEPSNDRNKKKLKDELHSFVTVCLGYDKKPIKFLKKLDITCKKMIKQRRKEGDPLGNKYHHLVYVAAIDNASSSLVASVKSEEASEKANSNGYYIENTSFKEELFSALDIRF